MKRRYLYSILFGVPGIAVSLILTFVLFGFIAGVLWVFIFGDNPWPSWIESALPVVFLLIFLTVELLFVLAGFLIGKRLEPAPVLNKAHILMSAGVTLLFILLIVSYRVSIGNVGPRSGELRCSEFCTQKGLSASSVSPRDAALRTCSCLDASGHEIIQVPLDTLDSAK